MNDPGEFSETERSLELLREFWDSNLMHGTLETTPEEWLRAVQEQKP
jgi:hypothetical protein